MDGWIEVDNGVSDMRNEIETKKGNQPGKTNAAMQRNERSENEKEMSYPVHLFKYTCK